jgi:hypothetical protein
MVIDNEMVRQGGGTMFGITLKRTAVRAFAVTSMLLLVLLLATTTSAAAHIVHRVHVGGPDICAGMGLMPGCDASFSLVAVQYADGSVTGQLTDPFGHALGVYQAAIDCLFVSGDGREAWLSGWITHETEGYGIAGFPIVVRVRDNGTSADEPPDQVSWPQIDFTRCDQSPDPSDYPLVDFVQGEVRVK